MKSVLANHVPLTLWIRGVLVEMTQFVRLLVHYVSLLVTVAFLVGPHVAVSAESADTKEVQAIYQKFERAFAGRIAAEEQKFIDYFPALSIERLYRLSPEQRPSDVPDAPVFHG
jgi:hypothetical protein